uniref:Putative secreted protein n=1 Tax=Anopheles marajoara TaxID=58244 RepID=A0A2M4CFD3_9DIPT
MFLLSNLLLLTIRIIISVHVGGMIIDNCSKCCCRKVHFTPNGLLIAHRVSSTNLSHFIRSESVRDPR